MGPRATAALLALWRGREHVLRRALAVVMQLEAQQAKQAEGAGAGAGAGLRPSLAGSAGAEGCVAGDGEAPGLLGLGSALLRVRLPGSFRP